MCSSWLGAGQAHAQVAFLQRSAGDAEVLEQLRGLLDEPLQVRAETEPRGLGAVMTEASNGWPERFVVLIDRDNDSVHALRPSDRTSVSRVLSAELLEGSPYAVALATAELLEWLGAAPHEDVGEEPPPPPAQPARASPPAAEPDAESAPGERAMQLGLGIVAGFELAASPSAELSLSRLALGLEGQLGRGTHSPWFSLGVRLSAPASTNRLLFRDERSFETEQLNYSSTELALQPAIGFGQGPAALALGPVIGLSSVRVEAFDRAGESVGRDAQLTAFVGLGLRLRYPLAFGFALDLAAEGDLLFSPVRYWVEERRALQDGPLRAQTRIGLLWESAFF